MLFNNTSRVGRLSPRPFLATLMLIAYSGLSSAEEVYNQASGKMHYMLQCQGCHRALGEGKEGMIPSMLDHGLQMLSLERGRQFFIRVPGSANSPLTDQQLADVLNYIVVDLLEGQTKAKSLPLFSEEEIRKFRGQKLLEVERERTALIDEITLN